MRWTRAAILFALPLLLVMGCPGDGTQTDAPRSPADAPSLPPGAEGLAVVSSSVRAVQAFGRLRVAVLFGTSAGLIVEWSDEPAFDRPLELDLARDPQPTVVLRTGPSIETMNLFLAGPATVWPPMLEPGGLGEPWRPDPAYLEEKALAGQLTVEPLGGNRVRLRASRVVFKSSYLPALGPLEVEVGVPPPP